MNTEEGSPHREVKNTCSESSVSSALAVNVDDPIPTADTMLTQKMTYGRSTHCPHKVANFLELCRSHRVSVTQAIVIPKHSRHEKVGRDGCSIIYVLLFMDSKI